MPYVRPIRMSWYMRMTVDDRDGKGKNPYVEIYDINRACVRQSSQNNFAIAIK
jgi:hypothetical protein